VVLFISLCHAYFLYYESLSFCYCVVDGLISFASIKLTLLFLVGQVWTVCWTAPILYKLSLCTYTTHSQGYHSYFSSITYWHFFSQYKKSSWIWQDPVKYPDNMSANFKSFLKGLLNKVTNGICSQATAVEFIHFSFIVSNVVLDGTGASK